MAPGASGILGGGRAVTIKVIPSSGNVFRDLGFGPAEAEHLRIRSDLMAALEKLIDERKLTQARAASLLGVSQPRVSDLVRGKIELFSIDTLVQMLARAGIRAQLVVESAGTRVVKKAAERRKPRKRVGAKSRA
jgi:predicted XRE-type DNA-binding protein